MTDKKSKKSNAEDPAKDPHALPDETWYLSAAEAMAIVSICAVGFDAVRPLIHREPDGTTTIDARKVQMMDGFVEGGPVMMACGALYGLGGTQPFVELMHRLASINLDAARAAHGKEIVHAARATATAGRIAQDLAKANRERM